jgi:hypothetical protein
MDNVHKKLKAVAQQLRDKTADQKVGQIPPREVTAER